jgi:TolB protein
VPTGKDPDANGRAAVQLIDAVKDPLWTYVTRDGHTLLFNSPATGSRNLWVLSLTAGGDAHQITSLPGDIVGHASLSPDGRRVAFISFAGGRSDVWTQNVDGSDPQRLTNDPDADSWPVWSPDGKSIVFSSIRQGTQTIQLVPTEGGPSEKVMDGFFRGDWIRTADGRSLLITNQSSPPVLRLVDMDRRTMIWQKPLPGGVDTMPMFSSDGRSISVAVDTDRSGDAIHVVDVDTGESKAVARLPFRIMFRASWTADAGFLVNRQDTESHIVLLDNFWPAAPAH